MEKETICWGCQNYAKCSWSKGIPVENWDATPTEIIDVYGTERAPRVVKSFCVHSCPQYLADRKQEVSVEDISKIIKISPRTFFRWIKSKKSKYKIKQKLKDKGYLLHIYRFEGRSQYSLEKVADESN